MSAVRRLATRLRQVAREEAAATAPSFGRWKVTSVDPLTVEQINGDGTLEEGDPDFEVELWLRRYDADVGLVVGDVLYVHHDGETWTAVGVAESDSGA